MCWRTRHSKNQIIVASNTIWVVGSQDLSASDKEVTSLKLTWPVSIWYEDSDFEDLMSAKIARTIGTYANRHTDIDPKHKGSPYNCIILW